MEPIFVTEVDLTKSYEKADLTLLSYTEQEGVDDKWNSDEFEYYRNLYASSQTEYIVTEASRAPKNYIRSVFIAIEWSLSIW